MSNAQEMVALYIQAEKDVLAGKMVRLGDRTYTSEDLPEIRAGRQEWEQRERSEQNKAKKHNTIGGLGMAQARFDQ